MLMNLKLINALFRHIFLIGDLLRIFDKIPSSKVP